jgi:GNAT superfamily N-acetyltransferase
MLAVAKRWLSESIDRRGERAEVFVAVADDGRRLGIASVAERAHFTDETEAYIGELATTEESEGSGVGRALLEACDEWARRRGCRILSLATGAANEHALGFYRHLGFRDEDVRLVKLLKPVGDSDPS